MQKSFFVLFITLFAPCLVAAPDKSGSMFSHIREKKLSRDSIQSGLFDARELIIDESRLVDSSQIGKKQKDLIKSLPGQPVVNFRQYGGYVTVDANTGRALYYYFAEAWGSPEKSPVLLWLNGGPGCSSLGYGAMQELGPFRVKSDGKTLFVNNYAWNKVANVIFLESPAGVGFSYSNKTTDIVSGGDKQTAIDNYVFLRIWLERFPEYKNRSVYLTGESYAGHYVPQLAQTIMHNNKKTKTIINLKGIMIGNAWIDDYSGDRGIVEYTGSHALISDDLTDQILKTCGLYPRGHEQKNCGKLSEEFFKLLDPINIYDIYAPLCHNFNLTDKPKKASIFEFDPCSYYYVEAYLNSPNVQVALHANVTKIPYKWEGCTSVIENWTDSPTTVLPILKELMNNGIPVWVYSGDIDARVPVTTTQIAIKEMKILIKDSWHPWYCQEEVGGYTQVYKGNLTFATARGAGHTVPSSQPQRALSLVTYFLAGKPLPVKPLK